MSKLDLIKKKAHNLGLKGTIKVSKTKNKKYDYVENNKKTSFGAKGYQDYLDHKDNERRKNYRKRHSGIYTKEGKKAIGIKGSPAYLSYNLLW